jgi:hypothetical protein
LTESITLRRWGEVKRLVLLLVVAAVFGFSVASASADPGTSGNNPKTQYRTFSCDDGNTYSGGFVGFASADFFIVGSTGTFAIKVFSEYTSPGGDLIATFPTGIQGYPGPLLTCSYTDPQGHLQRLPGILYAKLVGLALEGDHQCAGGRLRP